MQTKMGAADIDMPPVATPAALAAKRGELSAENGYRYVRDHNTFLGYHTPSGSKRSGKIKCFATWFAIVQGTAIGCVIVFISSDLTGWTCTECTGIGDQECESHACTEDDAAKLRWFSLIFFGMSLFMLFIWLYGRAHVEISTDSVNNSGYVKRSGTCGTRKEVRAIDEFDRVVLTRFPPTPSSHRLEDILLLVPHRWLANTFVFFAHNMPRDKQSKDLAEYMECYTLELKGGDYTKEFLVTTKNANYEYTRDIAEKVAMLLDMNLVEEEETRTSGGTSVENRSTCSDGECPFEEEEEGKANLPVIV
uniref:Uncharacterized protein n=1 Tax=Minutocellus polymorphus TaxID=265543 RepID=A0A7S0FJA0_9STRA|mmetsp:Transcript_13312/g.22131  ORF Transcript_13312/g.22131 Transcript_13312/m.22131 type:complete len:307 (+) Transcript_13312:131-1051(+)